MEPIVGVNYFDHQFLRKDDFDVARQHHVDRLRQHDYVAHTPGIVAGLVVDKGESARHVTVSDGRGIDNQNHEVVLEAGVPPLVLLQTDTTSNPAFDSATVTRETGRFDINLGSAVGDTTYYVRVRRHEIETDERTDPGVVENARRRERPLIYLDDDSVPAAREGTLILATIDLDENGNVVKINTALRSPPAGSVIGDYAVKEQNIATGAVSTRTIASQAVTTEKLADDSVTSSKIAEADNTPNATSNQGTGVKTAHLADGAVTEPKIADDAVRARHIAQDAVGTSEIQALAVTTGELGNDAVTSDKIADTSVQTGHLANGAVTSDKIAADQVLATHIAAGAVGTSEIAPRAVTTDRLAVDATDSGALAEADNASAQDTNTGRGVKTGHLANEAVTHDKLDLAVRAGVAAGFCSFNGMTDERLSEHNVEDVARGSEERGNYVITWREPISAARIIIRRLGGIALTAELESIVKGDFADKTAAVRVLGEALKEGIVAGREFGTLSVVRAAAAGAQVDAPAYLAAVDVAAAQVKLAWTEAWAPDAAIVRHEVARDNVVLTSVNEPTRTFTDTAVVQGKTHHYTVVSIDALNRRSDAVALDVAVPDRQPPTPPVLGVPTVASAGVQLVWQPSTDNVPGAITYEVMRDGLVIAKTDQLAHSDDTARAGRTYTYTVVAIDAAGNRSGSAPRTVPVGDRKAPSVPRELVGGAVSGSHIGIGWLASSDDTGVSHYEVLRNEVPVGNPSVPFFLDQGLGPGTYHYRVTAIDEFSRRSNGATRDVTIPFPPDDTEGPVESLEGLEERLSRLHLDTIGGIGVIGDRVSFPRLDLSPPTVPGTPKVEIAAGALRVTWTGSTDDIGVTGYVVYRDGKAIGHVSRLFDFDDLPTELTEGPGGVETVTWTDRNPLPGVAHRYSVEAYDRSGKFSGQSPLSPQIQGPDTSPPSVPAHLTVVNRAASEIKFAWAESVDNSAVNRYEIQNAAGVLIGIVLGGSAVRYDFTQGNLPSGATQGYRVVAVDHAGNRSTPSALLEAATVDTAAPSAPSAFTAAAGIVSVMLSWAGSTDNVGVKEYRVFRDGVPIKTVTALQAIDDHVRGGKTYTYTVAALDAAGNMSPQSQPRTVTTIDNKPPTVPQDVEAKSITPYEARVAWKPSTDETGVTGYDVFRDGSLVGTTPGTATVLADQNVRPGEKYAYTVRARDAENNVSAHSAPAQVTIEEEPEADRLFGAVLAFAYVPGQQRVVHVVSATPKTLEVQVFNAADGTPADGFLNVAAFKPTAPAGKVISLPKLVEEAPAEVLGPALGELDDDEAETAGGELAPSRVGDVLAETPDEKVAPVAEGADSGSVADLLLELDDARRKTLLEELKPESLLDLVSRIRPEDLGGLLAPLDDAKVADLAKVSPGGVLGQLIEASEGDRLAAIVESAGARDLGDAVLRIDAEKAGTALDTLSAEDVAGVVLAAPTGTREELIGVVSTGKFTDAIAAADEGDRTALLDATSSQKFAEIVVAAPTNDRATILDAAGDRQLAAAIVAADEPTRNALVDTVGSEALGGAIAVGGEVGVADVLSREKVAETIVATSEESRGMVIGALSDTVLAETVAVAGDDAKREIVGATSDTQLASTIALAPAEARVELVDAASDDQLRSTVLSSPQLAGSFATTIDADRATSLIADAPKADLGALSFIFR